MPKPGNRSNKKGGSKNKNKPFWQSTPFVTCMVAIAGSILLQYEPIAIKVDELFGTSTSQTVRSLQQRNLLNDGISLMNQNANEWCDSHPNTCQDAPIGDDESFEITLINKSSYRADIHWDDGKMGTVVATIDGNGSTMSMTVYRNNHFLITRHGVKEGLFDPTLDVQHAFTTTRPKQTFVIPENAAPSTNKCRDRFPKICQDYAKSGNCWESPGWMIVHCCQSCQEYSTLDAAHYIDSKVRCTKEHMNITEPFWKPGDLDELFTKWSTSPDYQQYNPTVLSSPQTTTDAQGNPGPWVITFDNFFSADEAQALIDGGQLAGFDRSTNQGSMNEQGEMEMVTSVTRTSSNAWCLGECQQLPGVRTMTKRIETVTGIPEKNYEPFQVLEYQDNQFYKMHHDSEGRDPKPPGNRILTFFLYLSDVEEGGETKFNKLDIQVKPKLGRALIWPSVRNDDPGFWDDRMYHEAMPVIKGKKYAANHWIHLNDYEGPNKWGCTGSFK